MKILLVIPPYRTTDVLIAQLYPMPLACVTIGTVLLNKGHKVTIKDFLLPAQKHKTLSPASFSGKGAPPYIHYGEKMEVCLKWLKANIKKYDVIGLHVGQCNLWETSAIIGRYIKELHKPLVIGGAFVTTATKEAIEKTGADVAVVGEGENVVDKAFKKALTGWKGIINGTPADINKIGTLAWHLAPPAKYPKYKNRVRGVLTISRGCPFNCSFCSVWTVHGRKMRRLDKKKIYSQLVNLWDCGVRYFSFLDDNLFFNVNTVNDITDAIKKLDAIENKKKRIKPLFYVEEGIEVRIAAIPGIIKKIVQAGFENVALGIETMNDFKLKELNKPYHEKSLVKKAVTNCHKAGITPKAFYIVGFPGDTVMSVCKNIIEFGKLGMSVRSNNLKLYPGADITKEFIQKGIINETYDWRMSSFYTPTNSEISFKQIKKLKTLLNAVGKASELFNINLFVDNLELITKKMKVKGYEIIYKGNKIILKGNLYRATPLRHMMEILMIRLGSSGANSFEDTNKFTVFAMHHPKNEIQRAMSHLLNGNKMEVPVRVKRGFF